MFMVKCGLIWLCGVLWASVLSSLARQGVFWRGKALSGRPWNGDVLPALAKPVVIMALLGFVRSRPVKLGDVLRGMALHSTALLCPVRLFRGMVSHGGAGSCPVGSSLVRHHFGKASFWSGDVLLGVVGFFGVLCASVRSYCGVAWNREALHGIVKFCPVKHCVVLRAKAFLRSCMAKHGTVHSGFARLRAAGQALVPSRLGRVLLCLVRWSPVLQGPVRLGHGYGGVFEK